MIIIYLSIFLALLHTFFPSHWNKSLAYDVTNVYGHCICEIFSQSSGEAVDMHLGKYSVCGNYHVYAANIASMSRG